MRCPRRESVIAMPSASTAKTTSLLTRNCCAMPDFISQSTHHVIGNQPGEPWRVTQFATLGEYRQPVQKLNRFRQLAHHRRLGRTAGAVVVGLAKPACQGMGGVDFEDTLRSRHFLPRSAEHLL